MKYASIDIGTNTLRLLIAEAEGKGALRPLLYKRVITRLGGNFTDAGIDPKSAERSFSALSEFKKIISENNGVDVVSPVATSAVRRAKNREWFLNEILKRTGFKVNVISGDEEARFSLLGVMGVVRDDRDKRLVIDIGGGSTEFITTTGSGMREAWSMEMGVVHLTEKFLKSDPPLKKELKGLEEEIKGVIRELKGLMVKADVDPAEYSANNGALLVGTAGTITTLAAMDQNLETYDRGRINNYVLSLEKVKKMYEYLTGLTLKEREKVLTLERGREDLIIPGSAITFIVMESFGFPDIKVSDAGLLEGVILNDVKAATGH